MPNKTKLPYRLGVGIMLFNKHYNVFTGKRIDTKSEEWQMPQGGIDAGENPETAAFRELQEETGITSATILATSKDWHLYDLPDSIRHKVWNGKYQGQKQKWFAMQFTGNTEEININTEHPEFCEWQWTNINDLTSLIVPFKQKLYNSIVNEFIHLTHT